MLPDNGEYLGVDAGAAMVGIARGSGRARLAEPLISVPAVKAPDCLAELADKHRATGIVVGLPRGLDGQDTPQTHTVKLWAEQIKQKIDLPFYWQDEATTSLAARQQKAKSRKQKADFDEHAVAAAIILQDFLDTPVKNRMEL